MKIKVEMKKGFDAVEFMRIRRVQIGQDISGMTFAEEKAYFKKSLDKLEKYKHVGDKD